MNLWLAVLCVFAAAASAATPVPLPPPPAPLPEVASGRIERLERFPSRHVAPRLIDVWLPSDFSPAKRYQVLYMHDGQNLFDGRLNWTMKSWRADVAVSALVNKGVIGDTIIVGIWNNGMDRYAEYYPQKFLAFAPDAARREYESEAAHGRLQSDAYLKFIVEELKPAIDRKYPTHPGRAHTFIAGSSMGGLISIYAMSEYPQVFGGAAGLSTHWVGRPTAWGSERVRNAALPLAAMLYLSKHLPDPATHRLYSDRGDDSLDALYAPAHQMLIEVLRDRGYGAEQARTSVAHGTGHNETDWANRLEQVLAFLLARR
ncbi:MAG: alpha/beta hydrolase [Betaproteobacteria bacterium]|nr:alpha/beta hydrolase [Betaproteobacteria bacterium]